ncbi:HAUS augmin-like complex subunit 4 [Entomortierella parvispora]|uniref:HAUS augmin-like complex subunit 4 n=1 Tax=Entomortierella parvispora TaxID=205924 RepID=A0A9P3H371_9FUNG|nr:HAUS augmin-like complex subunit 4 [Entomortierella parvispora]
MQDPSTLEQHPGLARLLVDLNSRFLTPTGLSLEYEQELHKARYSLKNKQSYLESKTVFEPLERLRLLPLENRDLGFQDRSADIQRQISDHIDQIITLIELRSLGPESHLSSSTRQDGQLNMSGASDIASGSVNRPFPRESRSPSSKARNADNNLLQLVANGVESDRDLDSITMTQLKPHLQALEGFAAPMMQAIQGSIQERAQEVSTHFHRAFGSTSSSPTPNMPVDLSVIVSRARDHSIFVGGCREESSILMEQSFYYKCRALFDTLQEAVAMLWELVIEFKIRHQLEENQVFRDYFEQVNQALLFKLRISAATLRQSVYNKETLDKLSALRGTLNEQEQGLTSQLQQNASLLQKYQFAGEDFNKIVQAYAKILKSIERVQYEISLLK